MPERTSLRMDVPVFFLSDGNHAPVLVKQNEARAGCALIDGSDVIVQGMRLNCHVAGYYAIGSNWMMEIGDQNEARGKEKETVAWRSSFTLPRI